MDTIIDIKDIKSIENDQLLEADESEISTEFNNEQMDQLNKKSNFCLTKLLKKIKKMFSSLFCQRNEEFLTVGERLLQIRWYTGFNVFCFYLCFFLGFCAIVNFVIAPNHCGWIYSLFFFAFFLSIILS